MPQITSLSQTVAAKPYARSRLRNALWFIMLVLSLGVVGYATRVFLGKPSDEHFARYIVPLRFHIAGGMGALLAGPWQFSEGLRNRALEFHRWIGRFYLLSVTLGSIAGFVMGDGFNGWPSHPSRIWHTGRSLVCHCSAGLPERA
jgi:hypothetical protein